VAGLIKDFSFVQKLDAFAASQGIKLNEGFEGF
jgi:hypothetical protein